MQIQQPQGMSSTSFLWDRESGLPLLVDDGSFGYVHADETPLDQLATGGAGFAAATRPQAYGSGSSASVHEAIAASSQERSLSGVRE
jgi:hypothetical protein